MSIAQHVDINLSRGQAQSTLALLTPKVDESTETKEVTSGQK